MRHSSQGTSGHQWTPGTATRYILQQPSGGGLSIDGLERSRKIFSSPVSLFPGLAAPWEHGFRLERYCRNEFFPSLRLLRSGCRETGQQGVQLRAEREGDAPDPERRDHAGKHVHGVVRTQNEDRAHLDGGDGDSGHGRSRSAPMGELEAAVDRDRGVPREEQVGGGAVGDEQGGEAGLAPDHSLGRRQRAETLAELAQPEEDQQPHEGARAGPEDRLSDEKQAEEIDQRRGDDQQRVGGTGPFAQVAIERRGEVEEDVADLPLGGGAPSEQGLGQEPGDETAGPQPAAQSPQGYAHRGFLMISRAGHSSGTRPASSLSFAASPRRAAESRAGSSRSRRHWTQARASRSSRASRSRQASARKAAGNSTARSVIAAHGPPQRSEPQVSSIQKSG